ncbi:MAG: hypothetical protein DI538_11145 [Azospira oryzae]|nr:MAG: hypothetical protein DI538_11145 [Azospira oryzae]
MMNTFFKTSLLLIVLSGLVILVSCKDDPELPENLTAFESDQLGLASAETELAINLQLTREAEVEGTATILIEPTGLTYGTDFTTEPNATANSFAITIPAGATTASFKVKKTAGALFDGDEKIKFTISSLAPSLVVGTKKELTVTFAEIIAASGAFEINGGGALYPNKVFIDLSANRQTAIARTSWDLAFSSSADEFRVILNSPNGMLARALDKTDLNAVTAADTVGFGAQLSLNAIFSAITTSPLPEWVKTATAWMDSPTGDWSKTAIASVSTTLAENKVYIINRGTGVGSPSPALGWKKIRVIRNGSNYTLQHADIGATTFTEVQVAKNTEYRFQYVSFATGVVSVEPAKTKWDIAWTGFTNTTPIDATNVVPYYFQDVILSNTAGVQAVQVLTSTVSYEAFAEANITGLSFSTSQIAIGSAWRSGGGPGTSPSIRADRFYVIKDIDGNYYKVKFTALTTNGERGKPQIAFALVKKAS